MAINRKPNPTGIDKLIDTFQNTLYNGLVDDRGWLDYESYHRAYKVEEDGEVKPERFIEDNEYKGVLMNDTFNVTSFFLISNVSDEANGMTSATISVIFQANLKKLYPTSPHRFDEEMINDIKAVTRNLDGRFTESGTFRTIDEVYAGFDVEAIKERGDDMQPLNVLRIDMDVLYQHSCSDEYATSGAVCTLEASINKTDPTIVGGSDGTAEVVFAGTDQGNITVLWSDGQTVNPAVGLSAGFISVLATDDILPPPNCTANASTTLIDPTEVNQVLDINPSDASKVVSATPPLIAGDPIEKVIDASSFGNDLIGTAPKQPLWQTDNFDFSAHALTSIDADFVFSGDFTGSTWINTDGTASTEGILGRWNTSGGNRSYLLAIVSGTLQFTVSSDGTSATLVDSGVNPAAGTWYYVCFGYDDTTKKIKISVTAEGGAGVNPFTEASHLTGILVGTASFIIGENNVFGYDGQIGWTRMFREIRTLAQCNTEYLTGRS